MPQKKKKNSKISAKKLQKLTDKRTALLDRHAATIAQKYHQLAPRMRTPDGLPVYRPIAVFGPISEQPVRELLVVDQGEEEVRRAEQQGAFAVVVLSHHVFSRWLAEWTPPGQEMPDPAAVSAGLTGVMIVAYGGFAFFDRNLPNLDPIGFCQNMRFSS